MRGTLHLMAVILRPLRIIPADAGNTSDRFQCDHRQRDHPRGCGEHMYTKSKGFNDQGSSPRMRGTLWDDVIVTSKGRIIPADAGNTRETGDGYTR